MEHSAIHQQAVANIESIIKKHGRQLKPTKAFKERYGLTYKVMENVPMVDEPLEREMELRAQYDGSYKSFSVGCDCVYKNFNNMDDMDIVLLCNRLAIIFDDSSLMIM